MEVLRILPAIMQRFFLLPLLFFGFSPAIFAHAPKPTIPRPPDAGKITIRAGKLILSLEADEKARITSLIVNGQSVLNASQGAYTSLTIGKITYSSLALRSKPGINRNGDTVTIDNIRYGDEHLTILEKWTLIASTGDLRWKIERTLPRSMQIEAAGTPVFTFDGINVWDGAYQGYGGLAWFYLFNEPLCTYGVHTNSSSFWNNKTGNGLDVIVDAPGKQVAMRYTRTADSALAYGITVSNDQLLPRYDSGTNRRRFIRGNTDVWAPYSQQAGKTQEWVTLHYFDVNDRYGRGRFNGLDGQKISAVLNTIARIGVIDSLHFGGNSWHTPYGPICLHEQYIAQLGLAIDDPHYLKGYQSCLDFYRDHAIKPDGRVFARWAYTDEDMMPGQGSKEGFYEAQWGILMDANPDFVSNVAELYDLTGDRRWVKGQQEACERALDWILARDSDGNGLVEMTTDNEKQKRGSDWIDIIWASYENAFVNAKLYHALVEWAAIERQLGDTTKASRYEMQAATLKTAFNKPTRQGGFWDEETHCYIHWRDKDGSAHGRNLVTPVNFMAIAYGICDDTLRSKQILDTIETLMEREHLFFWPLCMSSYAPGEGNDWQFPFPNYENGDLFLSWGSVAVRAYAAYRPELAVKYIRNVLDQYSKDGLAFQRYGRKLQNGLGDDILSGNSLSIVGLYQAIYGINPTYNRLYLDPHLTPDLAGTELRYNFRGSRLTISLDTANYSIRDDTFRITASGPFGFFHKNDTLFYFSGANETPDLKIISKARLSLAVQHADYIISGLNPDRTYSIFVDGTPTKTFRCDAAGIARLPNITGKHITIQ
jgi:hypothetical protein